MNAYFLHDGQNERGPFTLDELRKQKLSRNTPVRQQASDKWLPAEKIPELKEQVAPRKIRRPKDIVPVVTEGVAQLHRQRPKTVYGVLLAVCLLLGFSFYLPGKAKAGNANPAQQTVGKPSPVTPIEPVVAAAKSDATTPVAAVENSAKEDAAKAARLRWSRLVSVTNSNYGIGFLGGIKDLSVIVNNRSAYHLDEVVAKLTYIKASGGVWKTKMVTFSNVPANETKEQSIPDVSRGKKVKVSLYKVVSRSMMLSYTEGQKGKDAADPYYKEM